MDREIKVEFCRNGIITVFANVRSVEDFPAVWDSGIMMMWLGTTGDLNLPAEFSLENN